MTSLEELNNIVQSLQQTIQQQQEKNNNLERQLIEYRQDILVLEDNLTNTTRKLNQELEETKQKLEQTTRELQESQIQQNGNLETEIQRFNTLIDKLKGPNGETLKFACGRTERKNTQWVQYDADGIYVDIDISSAGFSCTPYLFTSLGGGSAHWVTRGATSIYSSENKGWNESFRIFLHFPGITPTQANDWHWFIQWLAVGI